MKKFQSYQQYLSRAVLIPPIRGKELFIRSVRRVMEQIRAKKKESLTFTNIEDAVVIFYDLSLAKCTALKKKLLDHENRSWTVDFAQQGGLQALLTYLKEVADRNLSMTDAILASEALQCLRAMMNIEEIFEHIPDDPQYIDSITNGIDR